MGAAATVPQLWVHSPGQCRHVHDTKRCQSCAATAACHAGLWSLCQTAGYVSCISASFQSCVGSCAESSVHSFVHACMYASRYTCIRFWFLPPETGFRTHLVHTVLCRSLHEVAVGQLAYLQQHASTLSQVRLQNHKFQLCFSISASCQAAVLAVLQSAACHQHSFAHT